MVSVNGVSNVNYNNTTKSKAASNVGTDFKSYLGESKSMDAIFDKAAATYNVPVELLKAIGKAESDFNAKAVSRSGAQGVMQLMPATAKELGVTNSFDPEQNIMGGAKYISGLLKKYNGDVKLALAAYNAGSGNVKKYGGIPPFKETQNYVKKVTAFMKGTDISGAARNTTPETAKEPVAKVTEPVIVNKPSTVPVNSELQAAEINFEMDGSLSSLDNVFTYDDYLKFLEMFLSNEKDKDSNDQSKFLAAQQINFNVPVMNLINSINI